MASARGDGGSLLSRRACHATHPPLMFGYRDTLSKVASLKSKEKIPTKAGCLLFHISCWSLPLWRRGSQYLCCLQQWRGHALGLTTRAPPEPQMLPCQPWMYLLLSLSTSLQRAINIPNQQGSFDVTDILHIWRPSNTYHAVQQDLTSCEASKAKRLEDHAGNGAKHCLRSQTAICCCT